MLYQNLLAGLMGSQRILGERRVLQFAQIVYVSEVRIAKFEAEDIEYPLGAMDGPTVVCEAAGEHARAQLSGDSEHLDQLERLVLLRSSVGLR
jgi:hypothetical protein